MPHVVNGIGTWYYGRKNVYSRMGTCESCNNFVSLASYDTTLYFVVIFIPIIPLSRKRVLDECASCQRHRVAPLAEWERGRTKDILEALTALREKPDDPERLRETVGCVVGYQDEASFRQLAEVYASEFTRSAEQLQLLGVAHTVFGHAPEAEKAYRASLALRNDPDVRELLAVNLMKQGRPEEARPLLQHILDGAVTADIGYLALLVPAFQARGMHEEALELLDAMARVFPKEMGEKEFTALRKTSTKHAGSHKPIASPLLEGARVAAGDSGAKAGAIRWMGPLILVVAAAIYIGACWQQGRARKVFMVNGLTKPYAVEINGVRKELPPEGLVEIEVEEGSVAVRVPDAALRIPDRAITVETSFFLRPFIRRTMVINPDETAVLDRIEATYTENRGGGVPEQHQLRVGSVFYDFGAIDYPFRSLPPSVSISKGSRAVKSSVQQISRLAPADALAQIHEQCGPAAAVAFVKNRLRSMPDHEEFLWALDGLEGSEEALEFLRPRLADRPVLLECHRVHQTLMERSHPDADLEAEYRALLAADPDNPTLQYLLGRILTDAAAGDALFQKAVEGPAPCAHAYYALAYGRLASADFEAALNLSRRAVAADPGNASFRTGEEQALLALGRYDDLLGRNREHQRAGPLDADLVAQEIRLLIAAGKKDEADAAAAGALQLLAQSGAGAARQIWADYFAAIRLYAEGDAKGYGERLASVPGPDNAFAASVCCGRLEEASLLMKDVRQAEPHLIVYLAAQAAGEAAVADREWKACAEILRKQGREARLAADAFDAAVPPGADALLGLTLWPLQKALILTALGTRRPDDRERFFALARKLNIGTGFPHLLLKQILKP